jgi:TonB family protein
MFEWFRKRPRKGLASLFPDLFDEQQEVLPGSVASTSGGKVKPLGGDEILPTRTKSSKSSSSLDLLDYFLFLLIMAFAWPAVVSWRSANRVTLPRGFGSPTTIGSPVQSSGPSVSSGLGNAGNGQASGAGGHGIPNSGETASGSQQTAAPPGSSSLQTHEALRSPRSAGSSEQQGARTGALPDSPPEPLHVVPALYTPEARNARFHGKVHVIVTVEPDGTASNVELTAPLPYGLEVAAREALAGWRFRPATSNGQPVKARVVVQMPFR